MLCFTWEGASVMSHHAPVHPPVSLRSFIDLLHVEWDSSSRDQSKPVGQPRLPLMLLLSGSTSGMGATLPEHDCDGVTPTTM